MSKKVSKLSKKEELLNHLIETITKNKSTTGDIVWAYGALGLCIGASIEGINLDKDLPSQHELLERYTKKPSMSVLLMAVGQMIANWNNDLEQNLLERLKENKDMANK